MKKKLYNQYEKLIYENEKEDYQHEKLIYQIRNEKYFEG